MSKISKTLSFEEFIKKVKRVLDVHDRITFTSSSYSSKCDIQDTTFGVIQKSNRGFLVCSNEVFMSHGEIGIKDPMIFDTVEIAFEYIWDKNNFYNQLGLYKDYTYRFDVAEEEYNSYYILINDNLYL